MFTTIAAIGTMALLRQMGYWAFCLWIALAGGAGASFAGQSDAIALNVEIKTQLDFSRAATGRSGMGRISIDPKNGTRQLSGDVVDLGGSALAGSALVTGEPGRAVRIEIPRNIRMTGTHGGSVEITNLRTSLPPAPKLDAFGRLEFAFGGDLEVRGSVAGTFRGRIPISAEYE